MNCNCVKEVEAKITTAPFITAKAGDNVTAECQATGLQFTDTGIRNVINIPFRIRGTGKGFSSAKGKEMPCTASYCPFCGRTTGEGAYKVGEYDGMQVIQ